MLPGLLGLRQQPTAVVGQDNPWDFVQDAFRRLADPGADSGPPLSLDTLMSGRPALLDKVTSQHLIQSPWDAAVCFWAAQQCAWENLICCVV